MDEKELIKIAKSEGESLQNLMEDKSNLSSFLKYYNISPGNIKVPNYLLYYYYRVIWSPFQMKMSKIEFTRKLAKIFERTRSKKERYFLMELNPFGNQNLRTAKLYDKKFSNKKRYKDKTRKRKISKFE